jgi:hypothetical protein
MFAGMSYVWIGAVFTIGLIVLAVWQLVGPRRAVGCGLLLALLVPEWVRWEVNEAVWFNVPVTIAAWSLILYMCHSRATYNFHLNWCDYAGIGMVAAHVLSDTVNDGPSFVVLLRAYGEWVLPYLTGRVAIQEVSDARWLLPIATTVTLILATFGLIEMFIPENNSNVFETLVQLRRGDEIRTPYNMHRQIGPVDFQRAYGPTNHPMYFGVLMFLLYPWMLYASARAAKQEGAWWWRTMPYVCFLGVVSSISRAPILAVPLAFYFTLLILKERWRPILLGAGALGVIALFLSWSTIQYTLESFAREAKTNRMVKIHGRDYRFTGTSHRWLMFVAYGPALRSAGPFGFGTERTAQFPPDVPGKTGIPGEMFSVDNTFLLYTLRFGFLGLLCFCALNLTALWGYLQVALRPNTEGGIWFAAMSSTFAAMLFVLLTVWMPQDYGFLYLFCIGASAGLWSEREVPLLPEMRRAQASRRRRGNSDEEEGSSGDFEGYEDPPAEEVRPRRRSRRERSED